MTPEKWKELRRLVARGEHYEYCGHKLPSLDEQCDCWMSKVLALIDAELAAPTHMDATIAEMAATIERLRSQACMLNMTANNEIVKREAAQAEARRLREAIGRAPHAYHCDSMRFCDHGHGRFARGDCDCFKREALATPAKRVCRWKRDEGGECYVTPHNTDADVIDGPCPNCGLRVEVVS